MGAQSVVYVDPAINANSGSGTVGDPYGDLQYALNTLTFDATNGTCVKIVPGTAEVLTGILSVPFTPGINAHLKITSSVPGTMAQIDGNAGGFSIYGGAKTFLVWEWIKMGNVGSTTVVTLGNYSLIRSCEVHDGNLGISATGASGQKVIGNHVHDIASGVGIAATGGASVMWNYLKNGASKKFSYAIHFATFQACSFNIISIDGSSYGIYANNYYSHISNNSILASSGTGYGIYLQSDVIEWGAVIQNNLIEGFSGSGGRGISAGGASGNDCNACSENSFYNNATNVATLDQNLSGTDNESLTGTPFAKSGSDTFENRFAYFAPLNIGSVRTAFPSGSNLCRGAVQTVGGSSGGSRLVGSSGLVGRSY